MNSSISFRSAYRVRRSLDRVFKTVAKRRRWRGCLGMGVMIDTDADIISTATQSFVENDSLRWIFVLDIPAFATRWRKPSCIAMVRQAQIRHGMPVLCQPSIEIADLLGPRQCGHGLNDPNLYRVVAGINHLMTSAASQYQRGWSHLSKCMPDDLGQIPIETSKLWEFMPRPFLAIRQFDMGRLCDYLMAPKDACNNTISYRVWQHQISRRLADWHSCQNGRQKRQIFRRWLDCQAINVFPGFVHMPAETTALAAARFSVPSKLLWEIDPPMQLYCEAMAACLLPPRRLRKWNDFHGELPGDVAYDVTPAFGGVEQEEKTSTW